MSRKFLIPTLAIAFLAAPLAISGDAAQAEGATRATTVKSSKSNTSDRMGGGGGKGTARATTVKSSKSNTSDRMGGGGGRGGGLAGCTSTRSPSRPAREGDEDQKDKREDVADHRAVSRTRCSAA